MEQAELDKETRKKIVEQLEVPIVNPFMSRSSEWTITERIKFVIGLFTLIPLRILLLIILLSAVTIVSKIAIIGIPKEDLDRPLPPSRRRILKLNK